jgi:hypothetical protein
MVFDFEFERAYEHARALCYPRRVGTLGERRAARYVTRQFASAGLLWMRERFMVSHFPAEIGSRMIFIACALLVATGVALVAFRPLIGSLCWGLAAFLVNAPWRVQRLLPGTWPPRSMSRNVLATLPHGSSAPSRIVFMAHYDTKSQWLPTGMRVVFVTLATGLCITLCLVGLIGAAGLPVWMSATMVWRLAALIGLCLLALIANVTGNRSPGAIDNGSAVGTLLELARSWRPRQQAPVEVVWVATGSEEVDLDGARHLLRAHACWWQEKPTLVINLESVGAGQIIYLAGDVQAMKLARQAAGALGLTCAPLRVLGAGMDHEPFAARGLPAVSILGDVVRKSFSLHSRRDDMGLVEKPALERAGTLAAEIAWRWADGHRPVIDIPSQPTRGRKPRLVVGPVASGGV